MKLNGINLLLSLLAVTRPCSSHVLCQNPIEINEFRSVTRNACVRFVSDGNPDNEGLAGFGTCDGRNDLQVIFCDDGTIRTMHEPSFCLTPQPDNHLRYQPCEAFPSIPDYQRWDISSASTFTDFTGTEQTALEIKNRESGEFLSPKPRDDLNLLVHDPYRYDGSQKFFFRSKGELLGSGRLQNQQTANCIRLHDNHYDLIEAPCETTRGFYFSYFANGELIQNEWTKCVDVQAPIPGNSGMHSVANTCLNTGYAKQNWLLPDSYCDGEYCSFINKNNQDCLSSTGVYVYVADCDGKPHQRWRFVTTDWVRPTAKWNLVGCNQNGGLTHTISNEVTYSHGITVEEAQEISSTFESGVDFLGNSFSTSLSTSSSYSLARTWDSSYSSSVSTEFSCDNYDSGEAFTGGCMWQLEVETKKILGSEGPMNWKPQMIKCTANNEEPRCPPFTKCLDPKCTECISTRELVWGL